MRKGAAVVQSGEEEMEHGHKSRCKDERKKLLAMNSSEQDKQYQPELCQERF